MRLVVVVLHPHEREKKEFKKGEGGDACMYVWVDAHLQWR